MNDKMIDRIVSLTEVIVDGRSIPPLEISVEELRDYHDWCQEQMIRASIIIERKERLMR